METPDTTLDILTLGRFSIAMNGKPVATEWPDESVKVLFCSLLSPLDLFFTWDRICRSMLGEPATRTSKRQLDKSCVQPLNSFLIQELGFNPLIAGSEGIRINRQHINVDALEFYRTFLEGLRLLPLDNDAAAHEKFNRANMLYAGSYLPGISGKIIDHTRDDLESLHQTALMSGNRHA